ncbi:hypothetical protein [Luteolibacter marinus]|uniref:hypothetical protein n=1 Tax=Luteolibacter marinus TaxID=2776705 RepID=UPI0018672032|nr:hypothetical protein [Luteolibacter marinus]
MKTVASFGLLLLFGSLSVCPAAAGEAPRKVQMRDVPTHEQVVEAARKALEDAPPPVFKPAAGDDPSVTNVPSNLISRSDIICYRGFATIVPKRAIIHVPKVLSDRLAIQDGSRLINWTEFLNANRAWIRTVQVSRVQAEGNKALDESTLKSFEKETRLVVATFQEGPISVLPLKVPEEADAATVSAGKPANPIPTVATP